MSEQSPPVPIKLEVSPGEIIISMSETDQRLSDEAKASLEYFSQDGLGITKLDERNSSSTYFIEYSPLRSGTDIIRVFGYLAAADLGRDIRFLRPDGQPHPIQLDNPQAD